MKTTNEDVLVGVTTLGCGCGMYLAIISILITVIVVVAKFAWGLF